ncbi:unnamed protein product [Closterium sp. NIES-64]|nr:unnamed protein product [Closterium sp. NIES-64]
MVLCLFLISPVQWLEYHRYAGVTRFYWYDEARNADEDQWLEHHRYAGVTRVYWYDEARNADEDQDVVLAPYIDAGLVVYHRVRELPFVEGNFTAYLNRQFRCKQGAAFNHWVQVGRKGAEGQSI